MFERTVSFWKRLLGRPTAATSAVAVQETEDERRIWVRYPADLETSYRPEGQAHGTRLSARVRNISLGGICLSVDRPFMPGDLLSVELPGATEQSRCHVLACVVHAGLGDEGEWILGCTFSRELSNNDLEAFGARRQRSEASDQRGWVRFPCNVKASYQTIGADASEPQTAKVLNLSASGVGLVVATPVENATLLSVELHAAHGDFTRTMLACVVHQTAQAEGEWSLGCNFIRSLSEEDLKALL
jgi:PilZ domain